MGSRSYFHYADITAVLSRGKYVGIDPLDVVRCEGGWELELDSGADELAEAHALFAPDVAKLCEGFDPHSCGAMFRLPLRRAEDVAREKRESDDGTSLGPEIKPARAEELLADWAEAAPRLLLFLSNVMNVSLYRWRHGAARPELVAEVTKEYVRGQPRLRLPPALPEPVTRTYASLHEHVLGLSPGACAALSAKQEAVVRVTLLRPGRPSSCDDWLVVERFDLITPQVLDALRQGCDNVPVVGLALPLTAYESDGVPFCFLPIGQMRTGMPVHVNSSFRPTPNRRELWLPGNDLDGNHAKWAMWNEVLMNHAVPTLWLEVLRDFASPSFDAGARLSLEGAELGSLLLSMLPDLSVVTAAWQPCAQRLYTLLSSEPLLPHLNQWVAPRETFSITAPAGLSPHAATVIRLYERSPPSRMREQITALAAATDTAGRLFGIPSRHRQLRRRRAGCSALRPLPQRRRSLRLPRPQRQARRRRRRSASAALLLLRQPRAGCSPLRPLPRRPRNFCSGPQQALPCLRRKGVAPPTWSPFRHTCTMDAMGSVGCARCGSTTCCAACCAQTLPPSRSHATRRS